MKTIAVIIAVNFPYYKEIALKAIRKYYSYFNIPVEVLEQNHPEVEKRNTSPVWNKPLLFDMYDADFIIAQDLDILPCNLKYNIDDFIDHDYINMAIDYTNYGKHYLDLEEESKGTSHPHFIYNAGLKCYPKKYKEFMREMFFYGVDDPYKWGTYDQYYINKYIGDKRIFVNLLPMMFNTFYKSNIDYSRITFCHYTNTITTLQKADCIKNNHPKEMLE
jgi:hypothetical protein